MFAGGLAFEILETELSISDPEFDRRGHSLRFDARGGNFNFAVISRRGGTLRVGLGRGDRAKPFAKG